MIPDGAGRRHMVERRLRGRGIRGQRALRARGEIPCKAFVPLEARVPACQDGPAPIGFGRTGPHPDRTALRAKRLVPAGTETVLEAGSGYAAAVPGAAARRVIAIGIVPRLAAAVSANLRRGSRDANVAVIEGDGSAGYAAAAPYDAISVAAAAPGMPQPRIDPLAGSGRTVIPVGSRHDPELRVSMRRSGGTFWRVAEQCPFVPLRGGEGWH